MDKHRSICDICRIPVASNFMHKHLMSERHLRAKAAKLFYKSKSKNKNKSENVSGMVQEEGLKTHSRVKGIWVLLKDPQTARVLYKNKLNGKTQSNKPIGLREEDIEEETFQSFVVEDYETVDTGANQEYEVPEIGQWRDTGGSSYWFGGEDVESEKEVDQAESDNEESQESSESFEEPEDIQDKRIRKVNPLLSALNEERLEEQSVLAYTERLKSQLENKQIDVEIVEKPEFRQSAKSSTFQKRAFKGKSILPK